MTPSTPKGGNPAAAAASATTLPAATPPRPAQSGPVPPSAVPRTVVCPICRTPFHPRTTGGQCPVCFEQVVPREQVVRVIPVVTPVRAYLAAGGWRLVLLVLLMVYQVAMFIYLWHWLATQHLL